MSIKKQCLDNLSSLIDEVLGCLDTAERKRIYFEAKRKGQECLRQFPDDAEINHMVGLILYDSTISDTDWGESGKYFARALEINPSHQYARMYLGHYFFDTGKYDKALKLFKTIDSLFFLSRNQKWRIIKLHELILCCKVLLNHPHLTEQEFYDYFDELGSSNDVDFMPPEELVNVLYSAKNAPSLGRLDHRSIKKSLYKLIESSPYFDEFKKVLC